MIAAYARKYAPECICAAAMLLAYFAPIGKMPAADQVQAKWLMLALCVASAICALLDWQFGRLQKPGMHGAFAVMVMRIACRAARSMMALLCILLAMVVWR
jgi:hypothetical protein